MWMKLVTEEWEVGSATVRGTEAFENNMPLFLSWILIYLK
jgi:hypothetical protein